MTMTLFGKWMRLSAGLTAALAFPATAMAQQEAAQQEGLTDVEVTDAIEDELAFDHAVPGYLIDVGTVNGIVTLDGTADSVLVKKRAADIARTVKGVRSVVNQIEVQPPEDIDGNRLREDVEAALLADPATDSFEITVTATDEGHVTLDGKVQSWTEHQLCKKVAMGVSGVTSVDNNITVEYETERPDAEIEREIEQALRWNSLIDDGLIGVEVQDGTVTLSGTVGSSAEQIRARTEAWVAGVKDVEAGDLTVAKWARDEEMRSTKYVVRSDDEVRRAVEEALLQDPRVAAFNVRTKVANGEVTLRGTVDNLMARRAAERDAKNTVGVFSVNNRLHVEPAMLRSANAVEQDIREGLLRDPYVSRFDITVQVTNGTAHLYGDVDTAFERAQAEDVASRVNGVIEVVNHVDVDVGEQDMITYDPYVDPWPIHGYRWYDYTPPMTFETDVEIRDEIKDELWWSPFVDADQVNVEVDNGVATLTGTVDSWTERASATENAYEGGATWVVNHLEVGVSDQ